MARKIKPENTLREAAERARARRGTEVQGAVAYRIEEIRPGYEEFGYYGREIPEKCVGVYHFGSETELNNWLSENEPDPGNYFIKYKLRLYERKVQEWFIDKREVLK